MKANLSTGTLWFVYGAIIFGSLGLAFGAPIQSNVTKLIMRLGEERVVDDHLKVSLAKGEDDFIVVTISKIPSTSVSAGLSQDLSSLPRLTIGTYVCEATETIVSMTFGRDLQERRLITLSLESIDDDGNVTAVLKRHNGSTGKLTGKLDATGNLNVAGRVTDTTIVGYWRVTLTANVVRGKLTGGTYHLSSNSEVDGEFRDAELQKQR